MKRSIWISGAGSACSQARPARGKSILLDALGLVLGDRADSGLVRAGTDKASATASFEFAKLPAAISETLDDADIDIEPGEPLIIRRQLKADGGSKPLSMISLSV